eukprot:982553-Amorphochlora_amoeboformis.AAC.1
MQAIEYNKNPLRKHSPEQQIKSLGNDSTEIMILSERVKKQFCSILSWKKLTPDNQWPRDKMSEGALLSLGCRLCERVYPGPLPANSTMCG